MVSVEEKRGKYEIRTAKLLIPKQNNHENTKNENMDSESENDDSF